MHDPLMDAARVMVPAMPPIIDPVLAGDVEAVTSLIRARGASWMIGHGEADDRIIRAEKFMLGIFEGLERVPPGTKKDHLWKWWKKIEGKTIEEWKDIRFPGSA